MSENKPSNLVPATKKSPPVPFPTRSSRRVPKSVLNVPSNDSVTGSSGPGPVSGNKTTGKRTASNMGKEEGKGGGQSFNELVEKHELKHSTFFKKEYVEQKTRVFVKVVEKIETLEGSYHAMGWKVPAVRRKFNDYGTPAALVENFEDQEVVVRVEAPQVKKMKLAVIEPVKVSVPPAIAAVPIVPTVPAAPLVAPVATAILNIPHPEKKRVVKPKIRKGDGSGPSAERPHACPYPGCNLAFADASKLKRHNLTHSGEKRFECSYPGCGKRFSLDFNLKSHMRTHTGDLPYACEFPGCGKRFGQHSSYKSHLNSHLEPIHEMVAPTFL